MTLMLLPGDCVTVMLPSGREVNIEVLPDATSISSGEASLLHEVLEEGKWHKEWPHDQAP